MLLYILDPKTFDRFAVIEEYESCIWTERYIVAGDVTLSVAANDENSQYLRPGVMLENEDSNYPMLIETAEVKDDILAVTGRTIETFFSQRSLGPRTKTDSAGRIMGALVDNMQTEYSGVYGIPGVRAGDVQADGPDVKFKIKERTKVYDLLLKVAQQHHVDMYVRRVLTDTGTYELVFSSRVGVNHTDDNPDGNFTVRFSPEDDNLIGMHEVYSAINYKPIVVVHVPARFAADGEFGESMQAMYFEDGSGSFSYTIPYGFTSFQTRIVEPNSEQLTNKYLASRVHIYYPGTDENDWADLYYVYKQNVLRQEMIRMGVAEYNKNKSNLTRAIDGEVAENTFKFGTDYRLGDLVEVTTAIEDDYGIGKRKARVIEYIRTADSSGIRAYPTLSQPGEAAPYDDSPADTEETAAGVITDHTFSINGIIPSDIQLLSPFQIRVFSGQTRKIVSISISGPRTGTCVLLFNRNGSLFSSSDLPLTLEDYDEISVDVTTHSSDASYISGHFTIETTTTSS